MRQADRHPDEARPRSREAQSPGGPGERSDPGPPGAATTSKAGFSGPDPEVQPKPRRRQFSAEYKRRILVEVDRAEKPGDVGALLRREGLYSSHLASWRKQRSDGDLRPRKRGRKPDPETPFRREAQKLRRHVSRLEKELHQAKTIIGIQKKLSEILGIEMNPHDSLEEDDAPPSRR